MRRREFMTGLGAAAGNAAFQFDQPYGQGSSAVAHRVVEANGIHLHVAEQGEGSAADFVAAWW